MVLKVWQDRISLSIHFNEGDTHLCLTAEKEHYMKRLFRSIYYI